MYGSAASTRLSRGRSTPAILATLHILRGPRERGRLTLPLLMPRIHANHPNHAVAPDDLALLTSASYRSSYFHVRYQSCLHVETRYARDNRTCDFKGAHADSARPRRAPNTLF